MKKIKKFLLASFWILFLFFLFFLVFNFFWPKKAGIVISSEPQSSVFINGKEFGKTPVETLFAPGEATIKLLPDNSGGEFETRINLVPGVKTVIQRHFNSQNKDSAGVVVTFEKENPKRTLASIISVPENAQVLIDGQLRGNAPLFLDDVSPGKHDVTVMATDYLSKTVSARFYRGYKFIAFFELSPRTSLGVPKEKEDTYVVLKEKTQGLESPSKTSKAVKSLNKGDSYLLLEKSDNGAWYKIKVGEDSVWIESSLAENQSP